MKVENGTVLEFIGISWDVPEWDFDHPCAIITPITAYSSEGIEPDSFIEEICENLMCGKSLEDVNYDITEEIDWIGVKLKTLQKVCKDRLNGKDTWKSKVRYISKRKVEFFTNASGDMDFKFIESVEA